MISETPFRFASASAERCWDAHVGANAFTSGWTTLVVAADWAAAMEVEMTNPRITTVEEVWIRTFKEVCAKHGVDEACQSQAIKVLADTWAYGAELRLAHGAFWSNLDTHASIASYASAD